MIDRAEAYGFQFAFPAKDTVVGRCLRDFGEFGRIGMTLSTQMSRGGVFIDVGANVGAYSLPVSRSASRVISIEAHADIAAILLDNVATNHIKNIAVIHAAVGRAPGSTNFPTPPLNEERNFGATGANLHSAPRQRTPVITLDEVATPDTVLVKVDVEGAESDVLLGAERTLSAYRPAWLVEANSPDIVPTFREQSYRTYWFWDPFVTPLARTVWPGKRLGDLSVLAIPAERPQPLGMVEAMVGAPQPKNTLGFGYLRAFGIREVG